ncbi:UNVERIFIED_CONTAM: hypothetical protein Sradi_5263500 [Sesamum radiatum]|uniref:Uncharacterized protein n=1 Tax=Sesamum radiatum TaxID=300843 RepID=A0AAW2LNV9_SESRA
MVFCPASSATVQHVQRILDIYKLALGQEINLHKSSATFSSNTPVEVQKQLADILGIRLETSMSFTLVFWLWLFTQRRLFLLHLRTAFGGGFMDGMRKLSLKQGRLFLSKRSYKLSRLMPCRVSTYRVLFLNSFKYWQRIFFGMMGIGGEFIGLLGIRCV